MPDGTRYNIEDGTDDVRYHRYPGCGVEDLAGVIKGISLPTGGQVEWTFQEYEFPPGDNHSPFNTNAGVKTRQLYDYDGDPVGNQWHYRVTSTDDKGPETYDRDLINEVVYPDGRCSKNYFNAIYIRDSVPDPDIVRPELFPRGWERGLPFVYHTSVGTGDDEKFLSSELYDDHDGTRCSGNLVQTTYLQYRRDQLPGQSGPDAEWYRANQTVKQSRVVYNEDGNHYVDTAFSDFTGVGSFRNTTTTGSLWSDSSNNEQRTSETDFDIERGTYPGNYNEVAYEDPWLFGLSTYTEESESEAVGGTVARVERQFDEDGFLKCTRVLANGGTRGSHDILTVYERDAADPLGLVRHVKTYGGDLQILLPGSVCGVDVAAMTPEFWESHDYQNGALTTSWQVDPGNPGAPIPFLTYDVDRDPANDAIVTTREANGFETELTYDDAGRLVTLTPAEGASTHIDYDNFSASPYSPATVTTTMASGANVLSQNIVELDEFGRLSLERNLLADGTYSDRQTTWDVEDRQITVSEWGDLSKKTTYSNFDPFGRPKTVTPPDGAGHKLDFDYHNGSRLITSTIRRALDTGSETAVDRYEEYDSYGRLRKVREFSGNIFASTEKLVINEVDADSNPGEDFADFIEIYGPPNKPLDDYVVVFYNGSNNQSYRAYGLDGFQTDNNGFFVIGDTNTPNVDYGAWNGNTLQDGPDGIGLYFDEASSFPNGTPVTNDRLIDALVYDTNDGDATGLLNVLTPGQVQVNEGGGTQDSTVFSNARVPNGGTPYSKTTNTAWFDQQLPTPGVPNDPREETPTTYFYDVAGHMTKIDSGLDPIAQTRTSTYDQRGFLLAETFPESPAGRTYDQYNSLGTLTRSQDGEHHLEYRYDYMNRLEKILDVNQGMRTVTENVWDTAPGLGLGKLHWAEQHNYIVHVQNLPWNASPGEDVRVRQTFSYNGLGGAESQRDTQVAWSSGQVVFRQNHSLTDLGLPDTYTYPRCISGSPSACRNSDAGDLGGTPRLIDYDYANGALTKITDVNGGFDWATWTYQNSGVWDTLTHTNQVTEHLTVDPNLRNRTRRITTTGVMNGNNMDTGILSYDGAGNLKGAGATNYTYDKVGRLAASINTGEIDQQFYYDRFGNMDVEDLDFQVRSIHPLTNRYIDATYDQAGNMLNYPVLFGGWHWFYNENNKVTAQNWLNYVYDTFGKRIGSYTDGGAVYHLRDFSGQRRSTISFGEQGGTWERGSDFILAGSRIMGSVNPYGRYHFHLDQLGSTRLATDENAHGDYHFRYAPYGLEYNTHYSGSANEHFTALFTGHERDFSTGSDYMHARHYNSQLGRFTSLDPVKGTASRPQSLNRYAYVSGNPLNATDPTGNSEEEPAVELPLDGWIRFGGGYGRAGGGYDNFGSSFWGFFGSGPTSVNDKHRAALAAQDKHQDFKPGWLTRALGPNWGWGNSSGEEEENQLVFFPPIQSDEDLNLWEWGFIAGAGKIGWKAINEISKLPRGTTIGPPQRWPGYTGLSAGGKRLFWLGRLNLFGRVFSLGTATGTLIRQFPGVDEWVQDWESDLINSLYLGQDKTRANSPFKGAL